MEDYAAHEYRTIATVDVTDQAEVVAVADALLGQVDNFEKLTRTVQADDQFDAAEVGERMREAVARWRDTLGSLNLYLTPESLAIRVDHADLMHLVTTLGEEGAEEAVRRSVEGFAQWYAAELTVVNEEMADSLEDFEDAYSSAVYLRRHDELFGMEDQLIRTASAALDAHRRAFSSLMENAGILVNGLGELVLKAFGKNW
ncbi:hypothetical protein [Kitasatospora mediocidica]|uniref:hypothetical protein n=1 Tax=Kitasatospora mediocidica TaxID=58352 RepID=UPI00056A0B17|nr:hypothetical protein [Kitasatospora mediocidica]